MLYLILTILGSLLTSVVLKINETRGGNRFVVAGTNYAVAALLALLMGGMTHLDIGGGWIGLGLLTGVGFIGGFLLIMQGISTIGLAIPTSAARLSMLIPVTGSILLGLAVTVGIQEYFCLKSPEWTRLRALERGDDPETARQFEDVAPVALEGSAS